MRWPLLGVLILGTIVGCTIGGMIFAFGLRDWADEHPNLVLWCTMATTGLISAIVAFFFFDFAVIIFSALMGAYIFIRGISIYCGNYPNEFLIFEDIRNNEMNEIQWQFWIYFSFMLFLALCSIVG